jgi:two-component system cell cycle sensor histidine kinase/response regulator CckA
VRAPLRVLHLEDDPQDAAIIQATLQAGGITCAMTRVEDRDGFVSALERGDIDLVLADFSLPTFDGLSAAEIVRTRWPAIPFVLVSGRLGEELAIDLLKSGATDYVLKEHLARLVPVVRRAMLDVDARAERQHLESQCIESQKLEVIGLLAGGVAHDFNNILAVIMGYTDVIAAKLDPDSPLQQYAEEIRLAAERAVGLTRQLLVFNRKQSLQTVVIDINVVVTDLESMLRRLIDGNIALTVVPGKLVGHVKADSGYVGQVVMNLVVNARDAMVDGGTLTVATNNVTLDDEYVRTHAGARAGSFVMLSVSDTGTGMTEEVKAHLFEPFFTTKLAGKGTGLGLATCQTIVRQLGGHIGVYSEVDRGTSVKVYLPRVDEPLDVTAKPILVGPLPRGTETLLLVEDDPAVRHLAREVLEGQGYQVLRASNGQDALRVVRGHAGAPIRLVITDVIMPVMGGRVMAEWLKATYPDISVLFTSGYTDGVIAQPGALDPGMAFMPKPYTPAILTRTVREMLDR